MIDQQILLQAIETWGIESQIVLAMEECAELIVALSHDWRGRCADVLQEIADVQILLDELKIIFGKENVEQLINQKMKRLKQRLDCEEMPFDYQAKHIAK